MEEHVEIDFLNKYTKILLSFEDMRQYVLLFNNLNGKNGENGSNI